MSLDNFRRIVSEKVESVIERDNLDRTEVATVLHSIADDLEEESSESGEKVIFRTDEGQIQTRRYPSEEIPSIRSKVIFGNEVYRVASERVEDGVYIRKVERESNQ